MVPRRRVLCACQLESLPSRSRFNVGDVACHARQANGSCSISPALSAKASFNPDGELQNLAQPATDSIGSRYYQSAKDLCVAVALSLPLLHVAVNVGCCCYSSCSCCFCCCCCCLCHPCSALRFCAPCGQTPSSAATSAAEHCLLTPWPSCEPVSASSPVITSCQPRMLSPHESACP